MLALIFTLALDTAVAAPPPGTYRYEAFINKGSVGGTTVTLTNEAQGFKITESSTSHLSTGNMRTNATLLLTPNLIPVTYGSSYKVEEDSMQAETSFDGRTATVTAGNHQQTFQLGGSSKSFIILDNASMAGFLILPAQMRAWNNADTTALVPANVSQLFLSVLHDVASQRPATIPAADVSLSFTGEAPFVEWYDPNTLIVDEVDVPSQNLRVVRRR
jgi:hypothetical protein